MMLLILPILPVQLITFDLVRRCRLNGVIGESNQIKFRPVPFISGLRLSISRVLLLILGLLLRWGPALHLTLLLRRVVLLITIILLRGRRRVGAATVSIRIGAVSIGIVRVPISRVTIGVRVAAESKIETRSVVRITAAETTSVASAVSPTVTAEAAAPEAAPRSAAETTTAAAAETATCATAMTTGESAAAGPASAPARVTAATATVSSTTTLSIGRSNQTREAKSREERDLRKFHFDTAFSHY